MRTVSDPVAANDATPLVSVIIPAYNSESYIAETIDSILRQDYPALEIWVVDDGSVDNTQAIVRSYGDKVQLLTQQNQGSAAARNLGVLHAQGKYIAFLDADDVWRKDKISLQVDALRKSGYKMAYSSFIRWHPDAQGRYAPPDSLFDTPHHPDITSARIVTGWVYADLLLDCMVWTSSVMVEKTEIVKAGLFDETLRKGQDYDLWLRLSQQIEMLGLTQPTALYRIHPDNITSAVKDVNYEYLILSRALARWGESGPDRRTPAGSVAARMAKSCFVHGHRHFLCGDPRIAARAMVASMKHSGVRAKPLLYLVAALAKCCWRPFMPAAKMRMPAHAPPGLEQRKP
jgi:glycosyltransferase involved in cell wall biosynthesis